MSTFFVENVCDVGEGLTLFEDFEGEDWALLALRSELLLLTQIFKKDVADADRAGIPIDHVAYYYNKFFQKPLLPKQYNKDTVPDVVSMVKDTVCVDEEGVWLRLACRKTRNPRSSCY